MRLQPRGLYVNQLDLKEATEDALAIRLSIRDLATISENHPHAVAPLYAALSLSTSVVGRALRDVEEKRMFGGLGMLLNGNMAVAVRGKGGLLVRIDPDDADDALREPGAKLMKMRGKAMRGWITVDPAVCTRRADVQRWVKRGVAFAKSLPKKG